MISESIKTRNEPATAGTNDDPLATVNDAAEDEIGETSELEALFKNFSMTYL